MKLEFNLKEFKTISTWINDNTLLTIALKNGKLTVETERPKVSFGNGSINVSPERTNEILEKADEYIKNIKHYKYYDEKILEDMKKIEKDNNKIYYKENTTENE